MPRRIPAFMCLFLLLPATPLAAREPGAPATAASAAEPAEPMAFGVTGFWAPESDTTSRIEISSFGSGRIAINAPGRFAAIAFFDGRNLIGVVCPTREDSTSPRIDQPGVLRAHLAEGPSLAVEFAEAPTGPAGRRDVWTFRGPVLTPMVHAPVGTPESPSGDHLPRLGEFVEADELPEAIERVAPRYPQDALQRGVQGTVLVQCLVTTTGRIADLRIQRSIPELDAEALDAVRQWRFTPARNHGKPVAVWITVPILFRAR